MVKLSEPACERRCRSCALRCAVIVAMRDRARQEVERLKQELPPASAWQRPSWQIELQRAQAQLASFEQAIELVQIEEGLQDRH